MTLEHCCIEKIAAHIRAEVGDSCTTGDNYLLVPPLILGFYADKAISYSMPGYHCVSITIEVRSLESDKPGIRITASGRARTLERAASDAGDQWAAGVVPVFLSWLSDQVTEGVERLKMVVGVPGSAERYGWRIFAGPVIACVRGPSDSQINPGDLSPTNAFRPLFDFLHPYAAHTKLLWIESVAARHPHGKVDATCRLRNDDWDEGRRALLSWAASWPDTGLFEVTKRQFVLLAPVAFDELASTGLADALESEMIKYRTRDNQA